MHRLIEHVIGDINFRFYEPVVFQPNIIPVCVPDGDENFIGRTAFVTGWGRLYEGEFLVMIQYKKRKYEIHYPGNQYAFE